MASSFLLTQLLLLGMTLAMTLAQFGFPGMMLGGGRPGFGGQQRGFMGGGFGALSAFTPPPPTTTTQPPQDPKKVAKMIADVIAINYEYHLKHDKKPEDGPSTTEKPLTAKEKSMKRVNEIKRAILMSNYQK